MTNTWTPQQANEAYAIPNWSEGLFGVDDQGRLTVNVAQQAIPIVSLAEQARQAGSRLPLLLRFPQILQQRADNLRQAFTSALKHQQLDTSYISVYPIKVNQQRSVVETLVHKAGCGLEVGSKPELLAALAISQPGGLVICNGYKDRAYIRLALIGQLLGLRTILVIEKPGELQLIRNAAESLKVTPVLGVRIRLASLGAGNWQNTGGERAKFGLAASQLLTLVERLKKYNCLDWLQLLHFHMGSQIANLRDIRNGVQEAGRYFAELIKLGCPIKTLDIGGGLGVDYEGARSRGSCSMNYSVAQYAECVVDSLADMCDRHQLDMPDLVSESGRALTAHHAVMITPVVAAETMPDWSPDDHHSQLQLEEQRLLQTMLAHLQQPGHLSPEELWLEASHLLEHTQQAFVHGDVSIQQRAYTEQLYFYLLRQIQQRLDLRYRRHRQLAEQLQHKLSDKYFINLSIFQSLPDIWALDQVFPIVPLQRLNEMPDNQVVLEDLTCDSDGRIDRYVDLGGIEPTLRVHPIDAQETYLLGIFMTGAYQETLGDIHNLFGDTDAVDVTINQAETVLSNASRGDTAEGLLEYVGFQPDHLLACLQEKFNLAETRLDQQVFDELNAGLFGYTYLGSEK